MAKSTGMGIGAIVPWFGGKRTMAPAIVEAIGDHRVYFEPFCGSLAVLLSKPPTPYETICDLHGDVTNLARVLQREDTCVDLYAHVQRSIMGAYAVTESQAALETDFDPTLPDVCRAFHFFRASWMGRNGTAGLERQDCSIAARWTAGGGSPAIRWRSAVESIPWWHERLKSVVVLTCDAFGIFPKLEDSPAVAIYADPPYMLETRSSASGNGRYRHDFSNPDHDLLANALKRFSHACVVLSYYDCPRVRELYEGWEFVECGRQKNLLRMNADPRRRDGPEAPEVLIRSPNRKRGRKDDALPLFKA